MSRSPLRTAALWLLRGVCLITGAYVCVAAVTWCRYGRARLGSTPQEDDPLLERFIPTYEVAERHRIRVHSPADVTFAEACDVDFQRSTVIRAIFKGRELALGAEADTMEHPRGLLRWAKALGWGVLAEVPGRAVVMGAVTQPWQANVAFRAIAAEDFAAFDEPGYVKIAWTLRADPIGPRESVARTETRAVTTDAAARAKFRRYWALVAPGIVVIRRAALALVKVNAERIQFPPGSDVHR